MIKEYVCEYCKTRYASEEACRCCEDSHMQASSVIGIQWIPGSRYPSKIRVSMPDGHTKIYYEGTEPAERRPMAKWQQAGTAYVYDPATGLMLLCNTPITQAQK